VLTIPLRSTASNAAIPTACEVAIIERLRDDPDFEHRHRELAIRDAWRRGADRLVERCEGYFHSFPARLAAPTAGIDGDGTRLSRALPSAR
jgi:hypothetical protein